MARGGDAGKRARADGAKRAKAVRWGGVDVETMVIAWCLPVDFVELVRRRAKRDKISTGAVIMGLIDPEKLRDLF